MLNKKNILLIILNLLVIIFVVLVITTSTHDIICDTATIELMMFDETITIEEENNSYIDLSYAIITKYESFSSKPYYCAAGIRTYGYGFTDRNYKKNTISRVRAGLMLVEEIIVLNQFLNKKIDIELTEPQRATLVSFIFNVGRTAFLKSTIYKQLQNDQLDEIPKQIKRWVYISKNGKKIKLKGLVLRRTEESILWQTKV